MGWITGNLKQTATVYSRGAPDGMGGYSFSSSTVKCRWEDKQVLFLTNDGEESTSRAIIYVDTDISIGSMIILGEVTDATPPKGSYEVLHFNKSPSVKGGQFERKVIV
jgi:hypothetical protein